MNPAISFLLTEQPYLKEGVNKIKVEVKKTGVVEADCSANVFLSGTSFYQPVAGQYAGRKLIVEWKKDSSDIQYVEFDILPSANSVEYLDFYLTDFVRCQPGEVTRLTLGLHTSDTQPIFAPTDGTYSQVVKTSETGQKIIEFQPIIQIISSPDSFIGVERGEQGSGSETQIINPKVDSEYFVINQGELSFKESFVDSLARPPSIVQDIEFLDTRITQLQGVVAPQVLVLEGEVEDVEVLRIEHDWGINPTSIITLTLKDDDGVRQKLGVAYEIEDNVAVTFYPYAPISFYYKISAIKT